MSKEFNIECLCREIQVSRSGYYKWVSRKGQLNRYERNREDLKPFILAIHDEHKIYGYRNIAKNVRNKTGWIFSAWLCHQVCKAMNIRSEARKHWFKKAGEEHEIYPNLLQGNYLATRPFEKVCTDTTMITHQGKKYDWNLFIDLWNNEIISYDFRLSRGGQGSGTINHYQALHKFQENKQKRGYNDLETILHSDQGSIYTSRAYNARLHYTIKRSMSRIATPTDNPVIESINGWIKDELRIDFDMENTNDIHKLIRDYVNYYNNTRLASTLKYKSPIQYRNELDFS